MAVRRRQPPPAGAVYGKYCIRLAVMDEDRDRRLTNTFTLGRRKEPGGPTGKRAIAARYLVNRSQPGPPGAGGTAHRGQERNEQRDRVAAAEGGMKMRGEVVVLSAHLAPPAVGSARLFQQQRRVASENRYTYE